MQPFSETPQRFVNIFFYTIRSGGTKRVLHRVIIHSSVLCCVCYFSSNHAEKLETKKTDVGQPSEVIHE